MAGGRQVLRESECVSNFAPTWIARTFIDGLGDKKENTMSFLSLNLGPCYLKNKLAPILNLNIFINSFIKKDQVLSNKNCIPRRFTFINRAE